MEERKCRSKDSVPAFSWPTSFSGRLGLWDFTKCLLDLGAVKHDDLEEGWRRRFP